MLVQPSEKVTYLALPASLSALTPNRPCANLGAGAEARVGFAPEAHTYDDRKIAAQQTRDAVERLSLEAAQ